MKEKMFIHYDAEGDFLEIRFGKPSESQYEEIGDDVFERRDEKTDDVRGYAFFNVQKRKEKQPEDIEVDIPALA